MLRLLVLELILMTQYRFCLTLRNIKEVKINHGQWSLITQGWNPSCNQPLSTVEVNCPFLSYYHREQISIDCNHPPAGTDMHAFKIGSMNRMPKCCWCLRWRSNWEVRPGIDWLPPGDDGLLLGVLVEAVERKVELAECSDPLRPLSKMMIHYLKWLHW